MDFIRIFTKARIYEFAILGIFIFLSALLEGGFFSQMPPLKYSHILFVSVVIIICFADGYRKYFRAWFLSFQNGVFYSQPSYVNAVLIFLIIQPFLPSESRISALWISLILGAIIVSVLVGLAFFKPNKIFLSKKSKQIQLEKEEEEELTRADFIKRVKSQIDSYIKDGQNGEYDALSLSIEGSWGEGKSWVLTKLEEEFAPQKSIIWVEFNPWLFKGNNKEEAYARALFEQINNALLDKGIFIQSLNQNLKKYANFLIKGASGSSNFKIGALPITDPDAESLRKDISSILSRLGLYIVISFEELDRLARNETFACLSLLATALNFKNAIVISCIDTQRVGVLLSKEYGKYSDEYLEKIFHIRNSLPAFKPEQIEEIFRSNMKMISQGEFEDISSMFLNEYRYSKSLHNVFLGIRRVKAIAAEFQREYVRSNRVLDSVDLFGIITLKHIDSGLYEYLESNFVKFTGTVSSTAQGIESFWKEEKRKFSRESWLILETLFPQIKTERFPLVSRGENKYPISDRAFFHAYFGNDIDAINYAYVKDKYVGIDKDISIESLQAEKPAALEFLLSELRASESQWLEQMKPDSIRTINEFLLDNYLQKNLSIDKAYEDIRYLRFLRERDDSYLIKLSKQLLQRSKGLDAAFLLAVDLMNTSYWGIMRDEKLSGAEQHEKLYNQNFCVPVDEIRQYFIANIEEYTELSIDLKQYLRAVILRLIESSSADGVMEGVHFLGSLKNQIKNNPKLVLEYIQSLSGVFELVRHSRNRFDRAIKMAPSAENNELKDMLKIMESLEPLEDKPEGWDDVKEAIKSRQ